MCKVSFHSDVVLHTTCLFGDFDIRTLTQYTTHIPYSSGRDHCLRFHCNANRNYSSAFNFGRQNRLVHKFCTHYAHWRTLVKSSFIRCCVCWLRNFICMFSRSLKKRIVSLLVAVVVVISLTVVTAGAALSLHFFRLYMCLFVREQVSFGHLFY